MAARMSNGTLGQIYLRVYDDFAVGTEEIAEQFGLSMAAALNALKKIEAKGLVSGDYVGQWAGRSLSGARRGDAKKVPGQSLCWQANPTYDEINREQAMALGTERGLTFPATTATTEPTDAAADDQGALLEAMALEILKLRAENIELLRRENVRLQAMALRAPTASYLTR